MIVLAGWLVNNCVYDDDYFFYEGFLLEARGDWRRAEPWNQKRRRLVCAEPEIKSPLSFSRQLAKTP